MSDKVSFKNAKKKNCPVTVRFYIRKPPPAKKGEFWEEVDKHE